MYNTCVGKQETIMATYKSHNKQFNGQLKMRITNEDVTNVKQDDTACSFTRSERFSDLTTANNNRSDRVNEQFVLFNNADDI